MTETPSIPTDSPSPSESGTGSGTDTIEPIPAAEARQILNNAIRERLGANWDDEETGWSKVTGHDYMARLTRGRVNMDFYVDLLGKVTIEEKEITPMQDQGRLLAWLFLLGSLVIAFIVARLTGAI
ncbi:MAG TPA: hypothetical protein VHL11_05215 [Phototrophicaceae bacterium]|nr:hypothetical protein [Phototrophicaceae bacterium]